MDQPTDNCIVTSDDAMKRYGAAICLLSNSAPPPRMVNFRSQIVEAFVIATVTQAMADANSEGRQLKVIDIAQAIARHPTLFNSAHTLVPN